jgi:4-amino-4-deoxy-L-arabinose transferase-like glycosyltransferase
MRRFALSATLARISPLTIFVLALLVRLAWILACPNQPISDQKLYDESARWLAEGKGYIDQSGNPANYWPVGYSAVIALFYAIFGPHLMAAYFCNALLLVIGVVGIYYLGRELFGEAAGRLSALIFAVHPTFILHTTLLASEVAFCAGLPWVLLALFRLDWGDPHQWRYGVFSGTLIAVLTYVRPPALLLLLCPLAFGVLRKRPFGLTIGRTALVGATAFALLLPWGFRNLAQFGAFSITSFNGGANFWMGNHVGTDGMYASFPKELLAYPLPVRDRMLRDMALDFIVHHPGQYLILCVRRTVISLATDTIGAGWNVIGITQRFGPRAVTLFKVVCTLAHWSLVACVVLACVKRGLKRLSVTDALLGVALVLLAIPFVFFVGGNRYMLPIVPVLIVLAGSLAAATDEASSAVAEAEPVKASG